MTPVLGRREQRFAELVDEAAGRHRRTDLDPELAPLVGLATRLGGSALAPSPGEEYRLGLRAMLLATIDREGIGATAVIPTQRTRTTPTRSSAPTNPTARRRRTRIAVLIGVSGALALSGVSQASVNARPGDPLYSIKRSAERAQLALASSDVTRGRLLLGYAYIRLQEAGGLQGAGGVDSRLQSTALDDMRAQSTEGFRLLATEVTQRRNEGILRMLDELVQQQKSAAAAVPDAQADLRWQDALGVLNTEDTRRTQLGQWLNGECDKRLGADEYGPVPINCPGTSSSNAKAGG